MGDIGWPIAQILIDAVMLLTVGLPTPLIKKTGKIFHRGFFCDDEDIMRPYMGRSTVENKYFHPCGCLINITVVLIIEYLRRKTNPQTIKLWRFKIPLWLYNSYYVLLFFASGVLSTILITTILKGSVGRLRPHFLIACVPNINCSLPENQHIYHTNYECTNKKFKQNTRLSFPSGHASYAMYCALFLAIFIQKRMKCGTSKLAKSTIEMFLILAAFYVGASRISDYKHHAGDVIGGFAIGAACALLLSANMYWPFAPLQRLRKKSVNSVEPEPETVTSKI